MNKDELLKINKDIKAKRQKDKNTERQKDKKMKDDEQDLEDTQTTSIELLRSKKGEVWGGRCHKDLLIY